MTKRELKRLERMVQQIRDLKIEAETLLAEAQACAISSVVRKQKRAA